MTWRELAGLVCATVIFVWSPLFARVRAIWPAFLGCAMCVGFWVGLAGGYCPRIDRFLDACLVSVLAWLVYLLGRCLDEF